MRRNLHCRSSSMTTGALASAIAALLLTSSFLDATQSAGSRQRSADSSEAQWISAGHLAEHPDRYLGERITVTAPVEDIYSRGAFTLDQDRVFSTGRDVIVLNPRPAGHVANGADVTVTGTLRRLTRTEVEPTYSPWMRDLSPELIVSFEKRTVLIADSIRTETGQQLVRTREDDRENTSVAAGISAARDEETANSQSAPAREGGATPPRVEPAAAIVSAGDLADRPDRYFGRVVSVTADVEDVYSRSVFALDEDTVWSTGEDILVVASGLNQAMDDDMYVTVIGEVVRFDKAEIERRVHGYAFDLRPNLMGRLDGRPVILATSVRTADGKDLMTRRPKGK